MSLLTEGQTLDGTYRLVRLIGEGGMGEVYEATHARLAGRYAIKVLLRDLTQNPEAVARFDREARVTSLLQHPNVVQVIDHNTAQDGTEYLVMEYLDGESLAQRVARAGPPPLPEVVSIIDQIAAGLAAAHGHGIVHRDLKPENVFLVHVEGRDGPLVKLLDFGISKVRGVAQTQNRQICGTPQYMAPEQVEARVSDIGGATDQYALAVIAYELLTGRNPFMGENLAAIFERVLRGVPPPTGLGRRVDGVLALGLAKSHLNRYPSATDFADALRGALLPPRVLAPPANLASAPREDSAARLRQLRPRRLRVPLALLALGGLVALFLYAGRPGRRPPRAAGPASPARVTISPPTSVPPRPPNVAVAPTAVAATAPPPPTASAIVLPISSRPAGQVRGREPPEPRAPALPAPRAHAAPAAAPPAAAPRPSRPSVLPPRQPADDDVMPPSETLEER